MSGDAIDELLRRQRIQSLGHRRVETPRAERGVAIVACMDARLNVERLFELRPGEAHVLRNAGGTVTFDTLRSLLLSQREMGTTSVMLVHHTDCGMTRVDEAATRARLLAQTGMALPFPLLPFSDVEADLRESMVRVATCPFLPHRDVVRGFLFDVVTGSLSELRSTPA